MQRVPVARAARPTGRLAKRQSRASRGLAALVRADSCLIVNTKGGGHAFIGLHLAKQLIAKGHKVTIMQDGDKVRCAALGLALVMLSAIELQPDVRVCTSRCRTRSPRRTPSSPIAR